MRKGDPPVMGITKVGNGVTQMDLRNPRKKMAEPNMESTAGRLPAGITSSVPFQGASTPGLGA